VGLLVFLTAATDLDRIAFHHTRVALSMFYLYKSNVMEEPIIPAKIYSYCRALYTQFESFRNAYPERFSSAPANFVHGMMFVSTTLIRLLKSSLFANYVDVTEAKDIFFKSLELARKLSVVEKDICAKLVPVFIELWNSTKSFKKPDGTEHIALRIRSRMIVGPLYDALWWWREEFQGESGAYQTTAEEEQPSKFICFWLSWLLSS
jgi:hypothetical protein